MCDSDTFTNRHYQFMINTFIYASFICIDSAPNNNDNEYFFDIECGDTQNFRVHIVFWLSCKYILEYRGMNEYVFWYTQEELTYSFILCMTCSGHMTIH